MNYNANNIIAKIIFIYDEQRSSLNLFFAEINHLQIEIVITGLRNNKCIMHLYCKLQTAN